MKTVDKERFARYQAVINILMTKDSFDKHTIYDALKEEKPNFMGRIINELVKDGYITKTESKSNPRYTWSVKKCEFKAGLWIDQQIFTSTVKRSPFNDRPRERLFRLGPSQLKMSELFAILIRSGLRGESALQSGEKLAAFFDHDLEKMSLVTRAELKQISRAIGETAYCQIMAALELGKRMATQMIAKAIPNPRIRSTSEAITFCQQHFMRLAREAKREEFHVVLLDEKYAVIKSELITVGLLNENLTHPREVFKPAIRESAWALILVHNHPNGDPRPSQDDKLTTYELKKAAKTLGLQMVDHIILTKDQALSMVEQKMF